MGVYADLRGCVAVVTGGARGIGAAIAEGLLAQGCKVAVCDVLDTAPAGAPPGDGSLRRYHCDVRDGAQVNAAITRIHQEFGSIDILINNAGISRAAAVWKMTDAEWDDVIDVNLKGCFNFIRAVAPIMRKQQSGRIVSLASINGERGKFGLANYSASKAGVAALTRTVARELGPSNVTVNAVAPGMIATDLTSSLPDGMLETAAQEAVLGRIGEPADVAGLIIFLCSQDAKHITGTVIRVDGGQCLG